MRDPSKPVSGLEAQAQAQAQAHPFFPRIRPDLTDPASVLAAVTATGATTAFIYRVFGAAEHVRPTLEALRAGGMSFVVFLSSVILKRGVALESYGPAEFIPWLHAQVEMELREVFGTGGYAAVRSGS
jgi:hypothetical protein